MVELIVGTVPNVQGSFGKFMVKRETRLSPGVASVA